MVQIVAIALLLAPLTGGWQLIAIVLFWVAVALTWISGLLYLFPPNMPTQSAP